jgi:hypothetical protein
MRRTAQFDSLPLVEDVLLQLFPVVIAPREDPLHEGIEVALGRDDPGGGPGEDEAQRKSG